MNTDELRELAQDVLNIGVLSSAPPFGETVPCLDYPHKIRERYIAAANPTAILELLDALKEIGELLPRCETIHKLGIDYDKEDGGVTRWSMGVSIAAQGRRLAIELQAKLDKL